MKNEYKPYMQLCYEYVANMNKDSERYALIKFGRGHPIRFYADGQEIFRVSKWKQCYTALQQYDLTMIKE